MEQVEIFLPTGQLLLGHLNLLVLAVRRKKDNRDRELCVVEPMLSRRVSYFFGHCHWYFLVEYAEIKVSELFTNSSAISGNSVYKSL